MTMNGKKKIVFDFLKKRCFNVLLKTQNSNPEILQHSNSHNLVDEIEIKF